MKGNGRTVVAMPAISRSMQMVQAAFNEHAR